MNCNSVKERLVDFLYEELPAESRTAFEEHLHDCSACRAEVASFRTTLGSARSALSGTLSQDAPVRVHNAVLAAAKQAAQAKSVVREAIPKNPELGFFARLWRTPWLVPAFGAVSVATVVFLVRVLKNPEVIPGQRGGSIGELTEPSPTQAIAPQAPEPTPVEGPSAKHDKAALEKPERMAVDEPSGAKLGSRKSRGAARETPRVREEERKGSAGGLRGELRLDQLPSGGAHKAAAAASAPKKMDRAMDRDDLGHVEERPAAPSRFAQPPAPRPWESAGATVERRPTSKDQSPPEGSASVLRGAPKELLGNAPQAGPSQRTAAPAPEPAKPASHAATMAARPLPVAAPAPSPAPPPPARGRMEKKAEVAAEAEASYAPAAVMQDEASEDKKAKAQPGPSLAESVRRADRLFADGSWSAAAEAYRDLLRRYPGHSDAGKWRSRMNEAVLAARGSDDAEKKAAKAKAVDRDTLQPAKP